MCLLQHFPPVCGLSCSLDIVFCRTEILTFNKVYLSIYLFYRLRFWYYIKNILSFSRSSMFILCYLLNFSIALHFTVKSVTYFDLCFEGITSVARFMFACGYPVFPVPFVEDTTFVPLQYERSVDYVYVYLCALCSAQLFFVYFLILYYLDCCSFILSPEVT